MIKSKFFRAALFGNEERYVGTDNTYSICKSFGNG